MRNFEFRRPPFEQLQPWFQGMVMHYAVGAALPMDLVNEIQNYCNRSPSSPIPEAISPVAMGHSSTCPTLHSISKTEEEGFDSVASHL